VNDIKTSHGEDHSWVVENEGKEKVTKLAFVLEEIKNRGEKRNKN
jgi:hypothetical protein